VVAGELPYLLSLFAGNCGDVGEVVVDKFLVRLVNERAEEEDACCDQGEAPERDDLDQVVGEEGTEESLQFISIAHGVWNMSKFTAAEANTFSAKTMR